MGMMVQSVLVNLWKQVEKKDWVRLAEQKDVPGIGRTEGIRYIDDKHPQHQLDIWRPEGDPDPLPTLVVVHGGGWMYGDKDIDRFAAQFFAAQDMTVLSIGYRLLPEVDLSGQVQDVFAALRWLEEHGGEHGCDLDNVFLFGDSSGGHLVALAACIQASEELQKAYGVQPVGLPIRAIAISHGVCDASMEGIITGPVVGGIDKEIERMMLGKQKKKAPWYGKIKFTDIAKGLALPPIYLTGAEKDVLHAHTLAMNSFLEAEGFEHDMIFLPLEGGEHLGHNFNTAWPEWEESIKTNDSIVDYFERFMVD